MLGEFQIMFGKKKARIFELEFLQSAQANTIASLRSIIDEKDRLITTLNEENDELKHQLTDLTIRDNINKKFGKLVVGALTKLQAAVDILPNDAFYPLISNRDDRSTDNQPPL